MIMNLKQFISSIEKYRKYNVDKILKEYKKKPKYGNRKDYGKAIRIKNNKLAEPVIRKLLASDIDFSKFGWVNKASEIIGITPPKVNSWMKRHMLDFYETSCFKKKRPHR